jgi:hypothetical protein
MKNPPAIDSETGKARWPIVGKDDICGYFRYADEQYIEADNWPRNDLPIYKDRSPATASSKYKGVFWNKNAKNGSLT